jgi:hypothetical protein
MPRVVTQPKMQRLTASGPLGQDGHAAARSALSGMIRNGDIDLEHLGDRSQHTRSLTQRLVEHQAKREARIDGKRRLRGALVHEVVGIDSCLVRVG